MYGISEVIEYAKAHGPSSLLRAGVRRFVFRYDKEVLLRLSLEEPIPEIQPACDVTIRKVTPADVEELRQSSIRHNWWRSKQQLAQWIARGYPLFVAIVDGRIVGYACVSREVVWNDPAFVERIVKAVDYRDDDAWGADAFVIPTYRGRRVYPALAVETMRWAKDTGYRRILAAADAGDSSAISAHKRIGYKVIKEMALCKILFFRIARIRSPKEDIEGG